MSARTKYFLEGDVSHLDYKDQVRVLSNNDLIREIEVNSSNVQYNRSRQRNFSQEMEGLLLCFEELRERVRSGRFR